MNISKINISTLTDKIIRWRQSDSHDATVKVNDNDNKNDF